MEKETENQVHTLQAIATLSGTLDALTRAKEEEASKEVAKKILELVQSL